jgi:hypothetical protein
VAMAADRAEAILEVDATAQEPNGA